MGWLLDCNVYSDATAAFGIGKGKRLGKVRRLDCTDLWVQDAGRAKRFKVLKVDGESNAADVLTKYVDQRTMQGALNKMGMRSMTGRPACAPAAMGMSTQ